MSVKTTHLLQFSTREFFFQVRCRRTAAQVANLVNLSSHHVGGRCLTARSLYIQLTRLVAACKAAVMHISLCYRRVCNRKKKGPNHPNGLLSTNLAEKGLVAICIQHPG